MGQKIRNRVKQLTDQSVDLAFGELEVDINRQNPSISFINEDYETITIQSVPDLSEQVDALTEAVAGKASVEDLARVKSNVDNLEISVDELKTKQTLTDGKINQINNTLGEHAQSISDLSDAVVSQSNTLTNLSALTAKVNENSIGISNNATAINSLKSRVATNEGDIVDIDAKYTNLNTALNTTNSNLNSVSNIVTGLQNSLSNALRNKGYAKPSTLNSLTTKNEVAVGDVYLIQKKGTLSVGRDGSFNVNADDLVVWVTDGTDKFWAPFGTQMSGGDMIYVIDGPKSEEEVYKVNWLCTQHLDENGDYGVGKVKFYRITKKGFESMASGSEGGWLPGGATTMTEGLFIIDADYNGRKPGTWQQAFDVLTGDIYTRTIIVSDSSNGGQKWTSWKKLATTSDLSSYQTKTDASLHNSFGQNATIVGAINSLRSTVATLSGDVSGIGNGFNIDITRTDNKNNVVTISPDSNDTIHFVADNDAQSDGTARCEDSIYMSAHSSDNYSTIHFGIKENTYMKAGSDSIYDYLAIEEQGYIRDSNGRANHKLNNNGNLKVTQAVDEDDNKKIQFSLSRIIDNPILIVNGEYKRTDAEGKVIEADPKFSLNWVSTQRDAVGTVCYTYITKDAIEEGTVKEYPSQFAEEEFLSTMDGFWVINYDHGYSQPGSTAYNNRIGTLQVAISVGAENRKAYRSRILRGYNEDGTEDRTWTSWAYEKLDDYRKDNILRDCAILEDKSLNWLEVRDNVYGDKHDEKFNSVSFYVIDKDGRSKIKDNWLFNLDGFKDEDDTIIVTNYDNQNGRYGSCQEALSLKNGTRAGRYIMYGTDNNGQDRGSYSTWKILSDKIDLSAYQKSAVTEKVYGTGTTKSNTVQTALDSLSNSITSTKTELTNSVSNTYQTKAVDTSVTKLTAKTVESSIGALATNYNNLKTKVDALSGNVSDLGKLEFEDTRNFGVRIDNGSTEFSEFTRRGVTYFGADIRFIDTYDDTPLNSSNKRSSFVTCDSAETLDNGKKYLPINVNNDALIEKESYNNFPNYSDGISYPYYEAVYTCPGNDKKFVYLKFYDFISSSNYLYAFSTGQWSDVHWSATTKDKAKAIATAIGKNCRLAMKDEVTALLNKGFKLWDVNGVTGNNTSDNSCSPILLTPIGDKIGVVSKVLPLPKAIFNLYDNYQYVFNIKDHSTTIQASNDTGTSQGGGAFYVLPKDSIRYTPGAYHWHAQTEDVHINIGDKKKLENLETIINKIVDSKMDSLMPIGTIVPYMRHSGVNTGKFNDHVDYFLLVENGGNWALCDGNTHCGYPTPNLCNYAPVGCASMSKCSVNSTKSATFSGSLHFVGEKYNKNGSLAKNGNRRGTLSCNGTEIMGFWDDQDDKDVYVSMSTSGSSTPGKTAFYIIRVK